MKKFTFLLTAVFVLSTVITIGQVTYTDDFEESHDYIEDGVEGTIWTGLKVDDGVVETDEEAELITLEAGGGLLTYTAASTWFDAGYDNGVLLYIEVPADTDFEATVKIDWGQFPSIAQDTIGFFSTGLMARVPTDADPAPEDPQFINAVAFDRAEWGAVHGMRDVYGGDEEELWNGDHSVADYPWMRLTREGDVYTAYFSPDGEEWEILDGAEPVERPDMDGYPLQVGLFHATYSENEATVEFSDFTLKTDEDDTAIQPIEAQEERIFAYYSQRENSVVLRNENNMHINSVQVFSVDGRLVRDIAAETNTNELRISSLDNGMYIIVAEAEGKQHPMKIVVPH